MPRGLEERCSECLPSRSPCCQESKEQEEDFFVKKLWRLQRDLWNAVNVTEASDGCGMTHNTGRERETREKEAECRELIKLALAARAALEKKIS
jgi:hypothetical protein